MRELYLYRRVRKFEGSKITRKSVSRMFRDDLLTGKVQQILYQKVDRVCIKEIKNKIRKKAETKQRGTLCALGSKGVTAVSRMAEKHTFYKNA